MATVRICGVQMAVAPSKKDNLPKVIRHIENCDCDFILFPEMSLTGYNNDFSDTRTEEAWRQIAAACRQSYVAAIIGTGAREDGRAYIQSRIFSDDGSLLGTHEKLVPTEADRAHFIPGSELRTFTHMGVTFGCLISNDFWVSPGSGPYPDTRLTYQLGQKGAQIIFHSINSGTDRDYAAYHESNLLLRARESGCYIVTANAASMDDDAINAPSGIISPQGEWLTRCPVTGEHNFAYDLEIDIP